MSERTNISAQPTYQEREQEHERDREEIVRPEEAMENELMPCPTPNCGRDVEASEEGVFCICGYRLDNELEDIEDEEPSETTIERHNTLARRARIGELCERFGTALMIGDETGCDEQMDGKDIDTVELVETWGAHARGKHGSGPTLLAALENLAKAIGGDDG